MAPETKALPGQPGRAYCPRCGRDDVTTRWERGVELYEPHNRFGSEMKCMTGSNRPVQRP